MLATEDAPDVDVEHVGRDTHRTRVTRVETTVGDGGRPFVLVAGVGVAATYFEFLAPSLAEHGDVFALDLPGFAGMPRPGDQPTAEFFADRVEEVLDHYGLEDPVIIGHSMGTQVVTEVLIRRPQLRHAVLVSPVVNDQESSLPIVALRFAQSATRETFHLAMTALSAYVLCGFVYFVQVLPHMLRYRLVERMPRVEASVLFIRGEYDATSPRRFHSRLVAAARNARRWEIRGAAHSIINAHAVGAAELIVKHANDSLRPKGRMPAEEAAVPPPPHAGIGVVWSAMLERAAEWWSAARRDEAGVERAKERHARILWRAYSRARQDPRREVR
ncbi:pimeloyl-ACP methyl ester carboxylesterase [Microbacterium sp. SORGH_AS 505]|uniref:alpha/beta fold hydrolase n=1 Tax=Microbacterium sp. SORGH_AS_0505 TaxID=3041770 RepID=UPI00277FD3FD|nr:alpha/beta fold hydrolase [Microbacterium sp. SORGH_AS_0505]MDQ1125951.1 pimeloyl-ACP methyl ester carboxylesterase [Microbacterium sp. SORGH_AS_0505]